MWYFSHFLVALSLKKRFIRISLQKKHFKKMYLLPKIKFTSNFNKQKLRLNDHVVESVRMLYTGNIILFKITIEFFCYKKDWIMQTPYFLLREYIKFFGKTYNVGKSSFYITFFFVACYFIIVVNSNRVHDIIYHGHYYYYRTRDTTCRHCSFYYILRYDTCLEEAILCKQLKTVFPMQLLGISF